MILWWKYYINLTSNDFIIIRDLRLLMTEGSDFNQLLSISAIGRGMPSQNHSCFDRVYLRNKKDTLVKSASASARFISEYIPSTTRTPLNFP